MVGKIEGFFVSLGERSRGFVNPFLLTIPTFFSPMVLYNSTSSLAFEAKNGPISATDFNRDGKIFAYAGESARYLLFLVWTPFSVFSPSSSSLCLFLSTIHEILDMILTNHLFSLLHPPKQFLTIGTKDILLLDLNNRTKSSYIQRLTRKSREDQRSKKKELK